MEQLLASRSVWGTLECQASLRRCTAVGVYLALLWSLSPLGGQSSLPALKRAERVTQNTTTLRYIYTGPYATFLIPGAESHIDSSLLLSATKSSRDMLVHPRDTWGNVRVPRLDTLKQSMPDHVGWHLVPEITSPEQFTSLLGLPSIGLHSATNDAAVTFTMQVSYMLASCRPWATFLLSDSRLDNFKNDYKNISPFRSSAKETLVGDYPQNNTVENVSHGDTSNSIVT